MLSLELENLASRALDAATTQLRQNLGAEPKTPLVNMDKLVQALNLKKSDGNKKHIERFTFDRINE